YKVFYQCNGERVQVDHCRIDDDGQGLPPTPPERNYCLVYYPDRPRRGGFIAQTAELYGDIVKKLQACGALSGGPSNASVAPSPSANRTPAQSNPIANSDVASLIAEGDKYIKAQDYPRAVATFKRALALGPNADAYRELGFTYYSMKQ